MAKMIVDKTPVSVLKIGNEDFISLTDMASGKDGQNRSADIIKNWIRTRYTLEFLGTWEMLNNPDFKVVEFDHFKKAGGTTELYIECIGVDREDKCHWPGC